MSRSLGAGRGLPGDAGGAVRVRKVSRSVDDHMNYSLNSLKRVKGSIQGSMIRAIEGDTRSLDNGSYV